MIVSRLCLLTLLTALLSCQLAHAVGEGCQSQCCLFLESYPARLKALRSSFAKIRHYYEANDDLETALLDDSLLHDFKTPFGCHAMNEVLRFYLHTVLPTAYKEARTEFTSHIDEIGSIFNELNKDVLHCRSYFACRKPFALDGVMESYKKMKGKGLYKAMGELDMLFNYIEDYIVLNRKKHRH